MTVNTINSVAEFVTNGVTTDFPFYFKFFANEDLSVIYINPLGVSTVLTLGTNYTVNGAGDEDGGSITTTTTLAGPGQLVISREIDAYQQTSLRNQGKFLAETHEDVFDKLTMLIQQGFSIFKRALTRPFGRDYFYAENRRITNVADPTEAQDAVTKYYNERYIAGLLEDFTGPLNNSANVMYIYPDGVARTVQSLATKNDPLLGSAGIAHQNGTVKDAIVNLTSEVRSLPDTLYGYASLQAALDAQVAGGTLYVGPGNYTVTSQLTMSIPGVTLWLDDAATINHNVAGTFTALLITGAGCTVKGGMNGGFVGPAVWDGANATPSYAVIRVEADNVTIQTRLFNIRKVGIWFKDCHYGTADSCKVIGNYPTAQWTGVETVHYGILLDPGTGANGGGFRVRNNLIALCVQGVLAGNYGLGGIVRGVAITGNNFEDCWNHGVYSNYTDGAIITANNFNRCQIPVVASGRHNNISDNTMHTAVGTVGDERDVVGISMRDASFSIVSNNTIKGVVTAAASVVINFQYFAGVVGPMNNNVVSGNTIEITAGNANVIRFTGTSAFGTNNFSNNIISNNTIRSSLTTDGAILLDGISGGANHGNQVVNNNILILGGTDGVRVNNCLMTAISGNTIEWQYDAGGATSCTGISIFGVCQFTSVVDNAYVIHFAFGQNLNVTGLRETAPASSNICHNNHDKVSTPKTATFVKLVTAANSLMDVQETGTGVPTVDARSGSTWRRYPFGGAGSSFYVKESSTGSANWVGK
ncbi:MAG: hypothetical protein KKC24_23905 [Gammaproteobacteria bacterium]|nr:hypothetical protein [Gammaproteobacteria bacterium]MBU0821892.1 hypothetical protein [Gammaproteobacteria bacterium]MBU0844005.1 hypothetical protein [Gammaproteobacteria bacterium]MBU1842256.1 hypothetical protein [Gammaproteobacteria bacterium]